MNCSRCGIVMMDWPGMPPDAVCPVCYKEREIDKLRIELTDRDKQNQRLVTRSRDQAENIDQLCAEKREAWRERDKALAELAQVKKQQQAENDAAQMLCTESLEAKIQLKETIERATRAETKLKELEDELAQKNAAIELAAHDLIGFSEREGKILPWVICNDIFYCATADGEEADWSEMPELLKLFREGNWPNLIEWVSSKRNMRPLKEVEEAMTYTKALEAKLQRAEADNVAICLHYRGFLSAFRRHCGNPVSGYMAESLDFLSQPHPGQSLLDRLKTYREALEFYGEESNWITNYGEAPYGPPLPSFVMRDGGLKAREALKVGGRE